MATYDRFAGIDNNYLFPPEVMTAIATASAFNNRFYTKAQINSDFSLKSSVTAIGTQVASLEDDIGLTQTRVGDLEQDTGDRDITSLVPNLIAGSGHWTIRRTDKWVYMNLYSLVFTPTSGTTWIQNGFLPIGFRPPSASQYVRFPAAPSSTSESPGPFRVDRYGGVTIYNAGTGVVHVTASWPTNDAFPTTLPGTPA